MADLVEAVRYWEMFGYRMGWTGELSVTQAQSLYGVESAARSVRMRHQDSDHGLLRLLAWEAPTGPGLGMTPFRARGSRWSAAEVAQIARPFAHAKYHDGPIIVHAPDAVAAPQPYREPFDGQIGVAFEMALVQPLARQVLFERADFPSPLYGRINAGSLFQASQFTHSCIMTQDVPHEAFEFYDHILGLKRSGDFDLGYDEIGSSGKDIFELEPGEGFHMIRFDDARSGDGVAKRSGRLILFNFKAESALVDKRDDALWGALGHTGYSWRVGDVEAVHGEADRAGCTELSDVLANEFGERSFTCRAPDGNQWCFVDARDVRGVGG
ncbi:MAG: VOC family protein [Parasphingopyxis sp.]